MKKVTWVTLFILVIILLIGCTKKTYDDEPVTIKVIYNTAEEFMDKYGGMFSAAHPNVEFEIISLAEYNKTGLSSEKYTEIVEKENPDLLFGFNLKDYSAKGKLVNLEPYFVKNKDFKLDQFSPNFLSYLRMQGDGLLYALSPTFVSKALYFNKTLFNKYSIPYPTDRMSWDEVIKLAFNLQNAMQSKSEEEPLYGFYYPRTSLFELANEIAVTKNMRYVDSRGANPTINTNEWKSILNEVIEGVRGGYIQTLKNEEQPYNPDNSGLFASGKAAMTVQYSYLLNDLNHVNFDWDIVTVPIDPRLQAGVDSLRPNALFGINSKSTQIKTCIKFLEFINGENYARIAQKSSVYFQLSAREAYNKPIANANLHAFYSVQPMDIPDNHLKSMDQAMAIFEIADEKLDKAIDSNLSIDELVMELEKNFEFILTKSEVK